MPSDPNSGESTGGGGFNIGGLLQGLAAGGSAAFPTVGSSNSTATSNSNSNTTFGNTSNSASLSQSQIDSLLKSLSELSSTSTTNPNLSPEHQALINNLISKYSALTNKPVDMSGYQTQQTQNINRNSNLSKQAVDSVMAARGLTTSPVSGTSDANIEASRVSQINNMAQGIPLLQNQMENQNLQGAVALSNSIPHGSTTTGFQSQSGTQQGSQTGTQSGSQFGTQTGNSNTNSSGTTTNKTNTSQGGGISGILQGVGAALPFLLAL